jgi:predicted transcriptional regulator
MFSRSKAHNSMAYIRGTLGPLERQVMEILWRKKDCSVRDVLDRLPRAKAYTTVMTTLTRLFSRNLATRIRVDRKFVYSARVSHIELDYLMAQRVLSCLLEVQARSQAPERVSAYILNGIFRHDPKMFERVVRNLRSRKPEPPPRVAADKTAVSRAARN